MIELESEAGSPRLTVSSPSPSDWEAIADWDAVVAASARPSIFCSRDWLVAWWAAFSEGLEPLLLRVADETGATVGIAPLYRSHASIGPLRLRRLGLLGDLIVGSEYLGMPARAGLERQVAGAVAEWLTRNGVEWDICDLIGLVEGDPAGDALADALSAGARDTREELHPCSAIHLPEDFEAYLASLGSKFRSSYRQRANKLGRTYDDLRFFTTTDAADLPTHLDLLFEMHQARWVAMGLPGAFADPRMRGFYADVSERLLASGRLRFWHVEAGGAIRASQFGFVDGPALLSLQEGYDAAFETKGVGGLGVVLRGHALKATIEEGLRVYDFLGGVQDFKERWGTTVHRVRNVRIEGRGMRGRLAWAKAVRLPEARSRLVRAIPAGITSRLKAVRARRTGG